MKLAHYQTEKVIQPIPVKTSKGKTLMEVFAEENHKQSQVGVHDPDANSEEEAS